MTFFQEKTEFWFFVYSLKFYPLFETFSLNIFLLVNVKKSCFQVWSNICYWKIPIYIIKFVKFQLFFWVVTIPDTIKLAIVVERLDLQILM